VLVPLATLGLSTWLAWSNDLPWAYTLTQLKWYAGVRPIPVVVPLPPGRYTMGCMPGRDDVQTLPCTTPNPHGPPMPVVDVTLDRPCEIGRFEVTFEQFDHFVWSVRQRFLNYPYDQSWGRGQRPVINVSWSDAQRYVKWLSDTTGQPWRLPTEQEWEYAARGGHDETPFWWGNEVGTGRARCSGCESTPPVRRSAPVGSYACNGFGVCDTVGNVAEWVHDEGASGKVGTRMLRGGSWRFGPAYARAASRQELGVTTRDGAIGFRVCRGPLIDEGGPARP
jgi:formylglycine-generating enzyme required for sulfatase activity